MPLVAIRASVRDVFPWSYIDNCKYNMTFTGSGKAYDVCQYTNLLATSVSQMP